MTDVNNLGLPGTTLVKMNSNLVLRHLVRMYNASVCPLSFEFAVLVVMLMMELYPTDKLTLGKAMECQIILKLVTSSLPLSPLFPLVSSIESRQSIRTSPGLIFICCGVMSNLTSLSSHSASNTEAMVMFLLVKKIIIIFYLTGDFDQTIPTA
uniref:Uncharacterized protein n=1 Tax=Anguilla anguilla TaxID=7936 RepID=A0A0E9XEH0_ANGAN